VRPLVALAVWMKRLVYSLLDFGIDSRHTWSKYIEVESDMVMLIGTLPTVSPQKTILRDSLVVDNEALGLSLDNALRLEVGGWRLEVGGWRLGTGASSWENCLLEMNGQKSKTSY
jgi:hypothetical protein